MRGLISVPKRNVELRFLRAALGGGCRHAGRAIIVVLSMPSHDLLGKGDTDSRPVTDLQTSTPDAFSGYDASQAKAR
jgi:hypothetical protein